MCAGQGTVGLEIFEQVEGVDTVLVAGGGGGLMAGIGTALDGRAALVAMEPALVPTLHDALAAGEPVDVPVSGVAADALGARRIGHHAFAVARQRGVRSPLVSDDQIIATRRWLWQECRIAVEHGAATALAGLHSTGFDLPAGSTVVVPVRRQHKPRRPRINRTAHTPSRCRNRPRLKACGQTE